MSEKKNNTFEEIWGVLNHANRILIPLHRGPDPDSIGSAVASAKVLALLGKKVDVVSVDDYPSFPSLEEVFPIQRIDPGELDLSKYDIFLAQDIAGLNRFSKHKELVMPHNITLINIDHHPTNEHFGDFNYIDSESPATAEILFNLYASAGIKLNTDIATALFFGIVSDSGWFAYGVHPQTYAIAQKCVEYGIDARKVSFELQRISIEEAQLQGMVFSRIVKDELNFVYSYITIEDLKQLGLYDKAYYSAVHIFKNINGINFGILITEQEPGMYKCSLRTREGHDFDVAELSVKVNGPENGGGHKMAAGFTISANSIEEVLEKVREVVRKIG